MSLRINEVAQAAGVNRETLRYYERRGLLEQPERSPGGHRLYDARAVQALRIIKAAQRLGFTLEEGQTSWKSAAVAAETPDFGQGLRRSSSRSRPEWHT